VQKILEVKQHLVKAKVQGPAGEPHRTHTDIEQALASLKKNSTANVEGGKPKAVINQGS